MKLTKKELQLLLNALIVWEDDVTFEGQVSLTKAQREQFKNYTRNYSPLTKVMS